MKTSFEMMLEIKKRPGLYLGCKSFDRFNYFMFGYDLMIDSLNISGLEMLKNFDAFVKEKYHLEKANQNWIKIIEFMSVTDEGAFENFFLLLDEYLEKNPNLLEEEKVLQNKFHNLEILIKQF